jgi:hypothetical protein|tara:strand:+ start:397 stop:768 length:372 start_codon:yes stop_codon:yes gene_type:complete
MKYLYFRSDSTLANDDDSAAGSNAYPVSSFLGMESTSDTSLTMYFKPKVNAFSGGEAANVDYLNDSVALTCGTNKQKEVMNTIIREINKGGGDDFIVVADDQESVYLDGITAVADFSVAAAQA